jgi:hypothetical protein
LKPVLVDTSVWRRYFAGVPAVRALGGLLDEDGAVLVHPFVIGEMVLGGLSATEEGTFTLLPAAEVIPHDEVLAFVRRRQLTRRGVGWIDAHLLASALATGAELWSVDRGLSAAAVHLGLAYVPRPSASG